MEVINIMKPIFEQERQFFSKKTGINLPDNCWRNGSKIYLDLECKKPVYTFKVEDMKIAITKDKNDEFIGYESKSLDILIAERSIDLDRLEQTSIHKTVEYIISRKDDLFVVSHSGGKDSTLSYHIIFGSRH